MGEEQNNDSLVCVYCGTTENLVVDKRGAIYPRCYKCQPHHYALIREKSKKTMLEKYGVENASSLQSTKDKVKATNVERYGGFTFQSPELKKQVQKTLKNKYGVDNCSKIEEVKIKKRKRSQDVYGTDATFTSEQIKEKCKISLLEKYGVDNPLKSQEIKDKVRATNMGRYGGVAPACSEEVLAKMKDTMRDLYGVEYASQNEIIKKKIKHTQRNNTWENFCHFLSLRKITPLFSKEEYISSEIDFTFLCGVCDKTFIKNSTNACRVWCGCLSNRSLYEDQISDWLLSVDPTLVIEKNKRFQISSKNWYEIDIYLPDKNIGIDFHGLYWHSDEYKDKMYHQIKYRYFSDIGVKYIQVFENEWCSSSDIIKSIILNRLGIYTRKIPARKCQVKNITYSESQKFLIENHISGNCISSLRYGLFTNNELVSVMTLGPSRYSKDKTIELLRFCSLKGVSVVGGFSKLLKYAQNVIKSDIYSFVDLRLFDGHGYLACGFKYLSISDPNYYYFNLKDTPLRLESRLTYQKHKLHKVLLNFDPNKTEYENMIMNGYKRIFDAGNLKVVLEYRPV